MREDVVRWHGIRRQEIIKVVNREHTPTSRMTPSQKMKWHKMLWDEMRWFKMRWDERRDRGEAKMRREEERPLEMRCRKMTADDIAQLRCFWNEMKSDEATRGGLIWHEVISYETGWDDVVECGQVSVELYKITSESAQRPMYPVLKSSDLDVFVSQNIYLPGRLTCNEKK